MIRAVSSPILVEPTEAQNSLINALRDNCAMRERVIKAIARRQVER